jgi:hypothetical protein
MADQPWQEAVAEVWQLFKETDTKFKETQAELDRRFKETDEQIKDTDQKLRRLEGLFGNQWGKLIEALVKPSALKLFQAWGLPLHQTFARASSQLNGRSMEVDLLLENSDIVLVVEVKSVLTVADVQDFLIDLAEFFDFFPRYKSYRVYGAVAGLDIADGADRYAYRQGLFVLSFTGEGVVQIKNDPAFQAKDFAVSSSAASNNG